jgi:DNA-binding MarR family transcriptional regulator
VVVDDKRRAELIAALDASISQFDREARGNSGRAVGRAKRITGQDWTFAALFILEGLKENEAIRMTELAQLVGTTPPTVTKVIKDLEARGFVDRTAHEWDGRVGLLSLTPEGRQVAEAIARTRLEALQQVLGAWNDDDLEQFSRLFGRLRADMRRLT